MAIPESPITLGSSEKTGLEGEPGASGSLIPSPLTAPFRGRLPSLGLGISAVWAPL